MPNKENIQKWADALQFGDFPQVKSMLRGPADFHDDGSVTWGYCGLGVACKTYVQEVGLEDTFPTEYDLFTVTPKDRYIPLMVSEWLGIDVEDERDIVHLNDDYRYSLPEIGTWVAEKFLKDE